MSKPPFVWELSSGKVVSHAIGSPHGLMMYAKQYTRDIVHFLDGKQLVLVEELINPGDTIDAITVDIATERGFPIKEIASNIERRFFSRYAECLDHTAIEPYQKGDEEAMKKLYEKIRIVPPHECNSNMVDRSLQHLRKTPSLIVINLAHLIVEPSMLTMYGQKGITVKRVDSSNTH